LLQQAERLSINPGSFAIAISREGVEADLRPVKERAAFKIVDGHTVFHGEAGKVGTQGQSLVGLKAAKINLCAATNICLRNPRRRGIADSIELAITNTEGLF